MAMPGADAASMPACVAAIDGYGEQGTEGQAPSSGAAAGDAMAAELERVLYAQMLVLFAPQAVLAVAHLPLLVHTLQSAQPSLRQAAAATLRHLAGESASLLPAHLRCITCASAQHTCIRVMQLPKVHQLLQVSAYSL